jgi:uncharacterized protein with von Willebrand factor type A (vWA) domain
MVDALEELDPDERELVEAFLEALSGKLRRLLDWLARGEAPNPQQMEDLLERYATGSPRDKPDDSARRAMRHLGADELDRLLARLRAELAAAGVSRGVLDRMMATIAANREALGAQVARAFGLSLARDAEVEPRPTAGELMGVPFERLREGEAHALRHEVARLAARLRSRASLRYRRSGRGRLDARRTLRWNLRHDGVPVELRLRKKKRKPSVILICDVSTSMRPVAEFMLRLIYELQDQVARARSFAFNDDLHEVSAIMAQRRPADAVHEVLTRIPAGYYATDLGRSLESFMRGSLDAVDRRTTVIVLGDGRNNHNPHRAELLADLRARSRRLLWLIPEDPGLWGTGDSDIESYRPHCDGLYPVRDMTQLTAAIDRILAD